MRFFKKKHKNEEIAKKVSKIVESTSTDKKIIEIDIEVMKKKDHVPNWNKETPHKINTDVIVEIQKNEDGERSFKPTLVTSEIRHPLALRGDQKIVGEYPDIPNNIPDTPDEMRKKLMRVFED